MAKDKNLFFFVYRNTSYYTGSRIALNSGLCNNVGMSVDMKQYVIDNIDKAIENDYIQVYYQPVARTITEEICAMEALARWNDPEFGLLSPGVFIDALEQAELIYKLDCCVVRKVCEDYRRAQKENLPFMPVSFNLSRLDFRLCDMVEIINDAALSNNVPLDMLRVEITESVVADDRSLMRDIFDRLADMGYRIWMDDFGSGYSSLNFLKDFDFETLKIDMLFLSDFNDRSRSIITSIVDMAKKIGIHTLAEGVETREQVDFLKSIGCEKVQGYYFGKPLPYDETLESIDKRGLKMETLKMRKFYHDIASVNILSATPFVSTKKSDPTISIENSQIPLAIISCVSDEMHYIFANDAYMQELRSLGILSLKEDEETYFTKTSPLSEKFFILADKADQSGNVESTDFIIDSYYCRMEAKRVASYADGFAILCLLRNYSKSSMVLQRSSLDETLRSLYSIYDRIELMDLETGHSKNLFLSRHAGADYDKAPTKEELEHFAKHEVYAEDRRRFLEFFDLETVEERIRKSGLRYISSWMRIKNVNGGYSWTLIILISAGPKKIMSCERRLDANIQKELPELFNLGGTSFVNPLEGLSPAKLWSNMVVNADIAVFWKDKSRRFLGANECFLDYFGLSDVSELFGKTDEDLNWHVDPDPNKIEEERVLKRGERVILSPGKVIAKGQIRDIVASKCPIYTNGQITGIMGYFFDAEQTLKLSATGEKAFHKDHVTGILDMHGLMNTAWTYYNSYVNNDIDFAMICCKLNDYITLKNNYGKSWIEHLLKKISDIIISVLGVTGIAAHAGAGTFAIIKQFSDKSELDRLIKDICEKVLTITENDYIPCTVYLKCGYSVYSECGNIDELNRSALEMIQRDIQ